MFTINNKYTQLYRFLYIYYTIFYFYITHLNAICLYTKTTTILKRSKPIWNVINVFEKYKTARFITRCVVCERAHIAFYAHGWVNYTSKFTGKLIWKLQLTPLINSSGFSVSYYTFYNLCVHLNFCV